MARGLFSKEDVSGFATFFAASASLCEYEVAVVSNGDNEGGDGDIQLTGVPGACFVDTLSVVVAFMVIDAGVDITLCEGESMALGAQSNLAEVTWAFSSHP